MEKFLSDAWEIISGLFVLTGCFILLLVVVLFIYLWIRSIIYEHNRLEHYDMNNVSIGKMSQDAGKSKRTIENNLLSGKYDKDEKFKI